MAISPTAFAPLPHLAPIDGIARRGRPKDQIVEEIAHLVTTVYTLSRDPQQRAWKNETSWKAKSDEWLNSLTPEDCKIAFSYLVEHLQEANQPLAVPDDSTAPDLHTRTRILLNQWVAYVDYRPAPAQPAPDGCCTIL